MDPAMQQLPLFEGTPDTPKGFRYRDDLLSAAEERLLVDHLSRLPFAPFEFHGFQGRRRVVSFGWRYAFDGSGLGPSDPMPDFLLPIRSAAGEFAALPAEMLEHVLITEYAPGAGIGWHKDRSVFGDTIGLSLLAPCRLRFRRRRKNGWDRADVVARPRSVYLLRGEVRSEWEHSIPPVDALRYSITFRTLAAARSR